MSLDPLNDALVTTDQADYAPGSTATITASGFGIGEMVVFSVAHVTAGADGIIGTADDVLVYDLSGTYETWSVVDGGLGDLDGLANGVIMTSWSVNQDAANQAFLVTVTDSVTGAIATAAFTDTQPVVEPIDAVVVLGELNNGILFDATGAVAGTGVFNTFVKIQGDGESGGSGYDNDDNPITEEGFNTSWRDNKSPDSPVLDTDNELTHNHSIRLSDIPTVTIGEVTYREFRLDLDESNQTGAAPINLDALKIYWSPNGLLSSLSGATEIYNMDGGSDGITGGAPDVNVTVELNAWAPGSGYHDYNILILDSFFAGAAGAGDPFIYLYSAFSGADSGFEEWGLDEVANPPPPPLVKWEFFKDVTVGDPNGVATAPVIESNGIDQPPADTVIDHANQVLHYTVTLINDGEVPISNITTVDSLAGDLPDPTGTTEFDDSIPDTYAGTFGGVTLTVSFTAGYAGTLNDAILDPFETWTWTYDYTVTQPDIDNNGNASGTGALEGYGVMRNDATVSTIDPDYADDLAAQNANPTSAYTEVAIVQDPGWALYKDVVVDPAHGTNPGAAIPEESNGFDTNQDAAVVHTAGGVVGQVLHYTVRLENDGNVSITSITAFDSFEDGPSVPLDTGSIALIDQGVVRTDESISGIGVRYDAILDPGETWTWKYDHIVSQLDIDSNGDPNGNDVVADGTLDNEVTASTTDDWDIPNPASETTSVVVHQNPDVEITKGIVCPGDHGVMGADESINLLKDGDGQVTYQVVVINMGNVTIFDPVVTDSVVDLSSVTHVETGGTGTSNDGILDVGETWTYTYDGTWAAGSHTNTAEVKSASYSLDESDSAIYFGADPQIAISKVTTGYVTPTTQATGDGLSFLAGYAVTWTYTVTNAGNVPLSDVKVTDSQGVTPIYQSGDTGNDSILGLNETWIYTATGTAVVGGYNNTGTAEGSFTDDCGDKGTDRESDGSSYTGIFKETGFAWTKGFWGQQLTAWDGNPTNATSSVLSKFAAGNILSSKDVLPTSMDLTPTVDWNKDGTIKFDGSDTGVLLGDANGNGAIDAGECTLFVPLLAAQQLINSSDTATDTRQILMSQALAAQLNIYNGAGEPSDLINEAVKWLTGKAPYTYGTNSTGNVDANGNGVLSAGTAAGVEYRTDTKVLTTDANLLAGGTQVLTSNLDAWQKYVDVVDNPAVTEWDGNLSLAGNQEANGEGLKNALMYWNDGHLVTSSGNFFVGWDADGVGGSTAVTFPHQNSLDFFWLTLHQQDGVSNINGIS